MTVLVSAASRHGATRAISHELARQIATQTSTDSGLAVRRARESDDGAD